MRRNVLKEIKEERQAVRDGRAHPILDADSPSAAKEKHLRLEVSRSAYAKLIRVARREKIGVSELIERFAREQK